jgi:hypothetical protein
MRLIALNSLDSLMSTTRTSADAERSFDQRMSGEELHQWLKTVSLTTLAQGRGIIVPPELFAYFIDTLEGIGYTLLQASKAESWMAFGDWTMRGTNPRLLLSDFFPSPQQVKEVAEKLSGTDLHIVTRSMLRHMTRQAYAAGTWDEQKKARLLAQGQGRDEKEHYIRELQMKVLNLEFQLHEEQERRSKAETKVVKLEEERERRRQEARISGNDT